MYIGKDLRTKKGIDGYSSEVLFIYKKFQPKSS